MRFEDALTLIGTASSLTVKETVSRATVFWRDSLMRFVPQKCIAANQLVRYTVPVSPYCAPWVAFFYVSPNVTFEYNETRFLRQSFENSPLVQK